MKRIPNPYVPNFKELKKLYNVMSKKSFDYNEKDFSIDLLTLKWKHNSWKTWLKGGEDYDETKEFIRNYIAECHKPYGSRDLSKFHLCES